MTKRSSQGAETRLRIIGAAADLFHKRESTLPTRTTLSRYPGTGKGQFYHYFKSKEGLVHEVLQTHLEAIRTGCAPLKYDIESWEDLERWFRAHLELQRSFRMTRGCPFGTIGNEVTENDELIRQDLCLIFEVVRSKLSMFFIKQKAKCAIPKTADEGPLADFCIATVQGAMLMGKIEPSPRPVETTVAEALHGPTAPTYSPATRPGSSARRGPLRRPERPVFCWAIPATLCPCS
jgi:TetR/AcrR family transcriptional repressor of nem operon